MWESIQRGAQFQEMAGPLLALHGAVHAAAHLIAPSKTVPFQTTRTPPPNFFERSNVLPVADGCDLKIMENNMQSDIETAKQNALSSIFLIPAEELARSRGRGVCEADNCASKETTKVVSAGTWVRRHAGRFHNRDVVCPDFSACGGPLQMGRQQAGSYTVSPVSNRPSQSAASRNTAFRWPASRLSQPLYMTAILGLC